MGVLVILLFGILSAKADSSDTVCPYYQQKSLELGCEDTNYLSVFGYHYCQIFVDVQSQFTPEGAAVFSSIRNCLIESLRNEPDLTCENARARAETHHVECYRASGYCNIGTYDRWTVFRHIWPELLDSGFRGVVGQIHDNCAH